MKILPNHVLLLAGIFIMFAKTSIAQHASKKQKNHTYKTYDQAPVPPERLDGYVTYLGEHICYPLQAIEAEAQGNIYLSLTINQDGSTDDEFIVKDFVGYGSAEQVLRVIKSMPPWKPAKYKGKPVRVKYIIMVRFIMDFNVKYCCPKNTFGKDTLSYPVNIIPNCSQSITCYMQIKNPDTLFVYGSDSYSFNGEPPKPPGGDSGLEAFFRDNIIYTDSMLKGGVFGTVYVNLVIRRDGKLSDFQIQQDNAGHGSAEEAIRVLKLMPPWKPGEINEKTVNMRYTIPVKF